MPRKDTKKIAKGATRTKPAKQVKPQPAKVVVGPPSPKLTKAQMAEHVGWLLVYPGGNGLALIQPNADSGMVVRVRGLSAPGALPYALDVARLNDTVVPLGAHKTDREKQGLFALTRREDDHLALLAYDRAATPLRFGLADAKRVEKAKVAAAPLAKRSMVAYRSRAMVDAVCNAWSFGR